MAEQFREVPHVPERPNTSEKPVELQVLEEFGVMNNYFSDEQLVQVVDQKMRELSAAQRAGRINEGFFQSQKTELEQLAEMSVRGDKAEAARIFTKLGHRKIAEALGKYSEFQMQQLEDGVDLTAEERNNIRQEGMRIARSAANTYANGLRDFQIASQLLYDMPSNEEKDYLQYSIAEYLDRDQVRAMLGHGAISRLLPDIPGLKRPGRQSKNVAAQRAQRQQVTSVPTPNSSVIRSTPIEQSRTQETVEKVSTGARIKKYLKAFALNSWLPTGKSKAGYLIGLGLGTGIDAISTSNAGVPVRTAVTLGLMGLSAWRESRLWNKFFKSTTAEERTRIETQMKKGASMRRGFVAGITAASFLNAVAPDAAENMWRTNLAQEHLDLVGTLGKEALETGIATTEELGITDFIADDNFGRGDAWDQSELGEPHPLITERGDLFENTLKGSVREVSRAAGELAHAYGDAFESAGETIDEKYHDTFDPSTGGIEESGSRIERPTGVHIYDQITVEQGDTLDKILADEGINPTYIYGSVDSMYDFVAQNDQILQIGNEEGVENFYQFVYDNPNSTPDEVREYFYDAVRVIGPGQQLTIPTEFIPDGDFGYTASETNSDAVILDELGDHVKDLDLPRPKPLPVFKNLGDSLMETKSGRVVAGGTLFGALMYRLGQKRKKK